MRIISWNVNSIDKRWEQIISLIDHYNPEIICIQETRGPVNIDRIKSVLNFNHKIFIGDSIKGRNGLLTIINTQKFNNSFIKKIDFNDLTEDRYMEISLKYHNTDLYLINVYVPHGGSSNRNLDQLKTKEFLSKILFLKKLIIRVLRLILLNKEIILCGDINVVPRDIDSWYHTKRIKRRGVSFSNDERRLFQILTFFLKSSSEDNNWYTWYSYKTELKGDYSKGLKIDFILGSNKFTVKSYEVIKTWRFDKKYRTRSDHAPILTEYSR